MHREVSVSVSNSNWRFIMTKKILTVVGSLFFLVMSAGCSSLGLGTEESTLSRERDAREALENLYSLTPGAKQLGASAAGVLVFPDMTKAGFLIGGQYGTGVLFKHGRAAGFYTSTAASYGLQAGAQKFGYALFFMTEEDLNYLSKSEGWEIGVGPTLTVVDEGFASSITTTTARKGVYAFFFAQKGLMAGLGIQGTKISKSR
jgi:lipid-binding SYLF domain-containing protein